LILSLSSILRPVAEFGIGPGQVFHLIGYFLPITLTFVLPIAALFAGSLVYGRFASDNEIDACKASGVSMLTLIYPGLTLALMVAIANLILSFYVMPAFVQRAEKSLKADAKKILFRNIERKGYYKLPPDGSYLVYADFADPEKNWLSGVVVIQLKGQQIEKITTADHAQINFNPHDRFNEVQIAAYNTYQMGSSDQEGFSAEQMSLSTEFGSLMGDEIKFKKIDEIKRIKADPIRFYPVEKIARQAYAQFIAELFAKDIRGKMTGDTERFYELYGESESVKFTAGACTTTDDKSVLLAGDVVLIEVDSATGEPFRTLKSKKVLIHIEGDEFAPTLTMEIYNPVWQRLDGPEGQAGKIIIRGLVLPKSTTDQIKSENVLEAIGPKATSLVLPGGESKTLAALQNRLTAKIHATMMEIDAEIHSRLVFGMGCVPLILIGIGLGVLKRGGHLLSAFGVSSVPAAILIVCIMMGKNITKNPGSVVGFGVLFMWLGVAVLFLVALVLYRKLLKN